MKKVLVGLGFIIAALVVGLSLYSILTPRTFRLDEKYYATSEIKDLDASELTSLLDTKESFLVFVYQPVCAASAAFKTVIEEFLTENPLSIYQISFSKLKTTSLADQVSSYPTLLIFRKGRLVDYLKTDQDADKPAYESATGLKSWLTKYLNLKPASSNNASESGLATSTALSGKTSLEQIQPAADGEVNIYFFWGDGCPRCAEEHAFFREIEQKYGQYYNLYTFEVWHDDANSELMQTFAEAMDEEVKGIPYTIIGDQTFVGFSASSGFPDQFLEAIEQQRQKKFDVYFDRLKQ